MHAGRSGRPPVVVDAGLVERRARPPGPPPPLVTKSPPPRSGTGRAAPSGSSGAWRTARGTPSPPARGPCPPRGSRHGLAPCAITLREVGRADRSTSPPRRPRTPSQACGAAGRRPSRRPASGSSLPTDRIPAGRLQRRRLRRGQHVERRRRRTLADGVLDAGDPERVAGVLDSRWPSVAVDGSVEPARVGAPRWPVGRSGWVRHHGHVARHRRHRLARQRHHRGDRRPASRSRRPDRRDPCAVGQRPARSAAGMVTVSPTGRVIRRGVERLAPRVDACEHRAGLEHVVVAPVVPHALREVRVEVAVEDRSRRRSCSGCPSRRS